MDFSCKANSGIESLGLCPKCGTFGISEEKDLWGKYLKCLYCGYEKSLDTRVSNSKEIEACVNGD